MSEYRHISKKKILILANFDIGLYKFRKALIRRLIESDNQVYISLPWGEYVPELEKMGCIFLDTPLERRGMNPVRDLKLFHQYWKMLRKVQPDLVISYTIKPNIYGGMACGLLGTDYAVNITGLGTAIESGGVLQKLVFTLYRIALRKARVVFFENQDNRNVLVSANIVPLDKTVVLNGAGVDTSEYPALPYPPDGPIHFLFVGRIMKEKGVDELFSAMKLLKKHYGDQIVLDVVGLFEESYEEIINELNRDGTVVFHGYQSDMLPFYQAAHCAVLPSYHEGMSNVLLEAASSGRAVITSNIHGCMEAVLDGVSGYLCKVKDAEDLHVQMERFMQLSHAEKKHFGDMGRTHMLTHFEKEKIVDKTISSIVQNTENA